MAIDISAPGASEDALEAALRARMEFVGARISRVTNAAASSAGADALIPFTTEDLDTHACADLVSNANRLYLPTGFSKFRLRAYARASANITSTVFLNIKKNGNFLTAADGVLETAHAGQAWYAESGYMTGTGGTDYFELNTFSSAARTIAAAWFEIQLLG